MIATLALCAAFSSPLSLSSSTSRNTNVQLSASTRRAVLAQTSALVAAIVSASSAQAVDAIEKVSSYSKGSEGGDAAVYTPKARIEAGGAKSTRLIMSLPSPGPLSARDYIDAMWFEDSKGTVLAAGEFRADGKGIKEQVSGIAAAPVEPKYQARIDAGTGDVFPVVHSNKGFVWKGKPVFVK